MIHKTDPDARDTDGIIFPFFHVAMDGVLYAGKQSFRHCGQDPCPGPAASQHSDLMATVADDNLGLCAEPRSFCPFMENSPGSLKCTGCAKCLIDTNACRVKDLLRPLFRTDIQKLYIKGTAVTVDWRARQITDEERSGYSLR